MERTTPPTAKFSAPPLLSIPIEIFVLIFESGALEFRDAVALRLTCRHLYECTRSRTFWLVLCKISQKHVPLPSSIRQSLSVLSEKELETICLSKHRTEQNLKSHAPLCGDMCYLELPETSSAQNVSQFCFIRGGDYVLTVLSDGTVSLWESSILPKRLFLGAETEDPRGDRLGLGGPLLQYEAQSSPDSIFYRQYGVNDETIAVSLITLLNADEMEVHAFEIIINSDGSARIGHLCRFATGVNIGEGVSQTFALRGQIALMSRSGRETLCIILLDYMKDQAAMVLVKLEEALLDEHYPDITANHGDLFVYCAAPRELLVSKITAPWDSLPSHGGTPQKPLPFIPLDHESARSFAYHEDCRFPLPFYETSISPWDTPDLLNDIKLPIINAFTWTESHPSLTSATTGLTICQHWLDLEAIGPSASNDGLDREIDFHRAHFDIPEEIADSRDGMSIIMATGTCARHCVWLDKATWSVQAVVLRSPSQDAELGAANLDLSSSRRTLNLPFKVPEIGSIDFCDQTGVLAITPYGDRDPLSQNGCLRVYFFQF